MPHRGNLLLASLSPGDLAALQPHLKPLHLEQDQVLFEAGDTIDATYFPTSAVVSIVVMLSSGQVVEAAMVGRDGVLGAAAALDGKMALSRAVIQLSGEAMVCGLEGLRAAAMQSQPFLSLLIRLSRPYMRRRSNRPPALRRIMWRPVFAGGCSGRETCRKTIRFYSRKSSWQRCSVSIERA
ncbi:Crp/Fnr family transcriptional regulator [Bradyrhizobium sp. USDA 3364]